MPPKTEKEIIDLFNLGDKDSDGKLNKDEILNLLTMIGEDIETTETKNKIVQFTIQFGLIDLEGFKLGFELSTKDKDEKEGKKMTEKEKEEMLLMLPEIFNTHDLDKDGYITFEELVLCTIYLNTMDYGVELSFEEASSYAKPLFLELAFLTQNKFVELNLFEEKYMLVTDVYKTILHRLPDEAGLMHFIERLLDPNDLLKTKEDLVHLFKQSNEYKSASNELSLIKKLLAESEASICAANAELSCYIDHAPLKELPKYHDITSNQTCICCCEFSDLTEEDVDFEQLALYSCIMVENGCVESYTYFCNGNLYVIDHGNSSTAIVNAWTAYLKYAQSLPTIPNYWPKKDKSKMKFRLFLIGGDEKELEFCQNLQDTVFVPQGYIIEKPVIQEEKCTSVVSNIVYPAKPYVLSTGEKDITSCDTCVCVCVTKNVKKEDIDLEACLKFEEIMVSNGCTEAYSFFENGNFCLCDHANDSESFKHAWNTYLNYVASLPVPPNYFPNKTPEEVKALEFEIFLIGGTHEEKEFCDNLVENIFKKSYTVTKECEQYPKNHNIISTSLYPLIPHGKK